MSPTSYQTALPRGASRNLRHRLPPRQWPVVLMTFPQAISAARWVEL